MHLLKRMLQGVVALAAAALLIWVVAHLYAPEAEPCGISGNCPIVSVPFAHLWRTVFVSSILIAAYGCVGLLCSGILYLRKKPALRVFLLSLMVTVVSCLIILVTNVLPCDKNPYGCSGEPRLPDSLLQ